MVRGVAGRSLPLAALLALAVVQVEAAGPSFPCNKTFSGSIEERICRDAGLSALDLHLAEVYAAAERKADNEHPPFLRAEQRGWIKGRNDCWKSKDVRLCVEDAYRLRITELQARYRLVEALGPFRFACDGSAANELVVTHFRTDPPSLIAERGDETSLMRQVPAASGTRYEGRNESFWEHHGEATVVWGWQATPMHCVRKP